MLNLHDLFTPMGGEPVEVPPEGLSCAAAMEAVSAIMNEKFIHIRPAYRKILVDTFGQMVREALSQTSVSPGLPPQKTEQKPLSQVYICSRYGGRDAAEVEKHVHEARKFADFVIASGNVPVAPPLMFPCVPDDNIPEERRAGRTPGLRLMLWVEEVWVFCVDGVSEGMMDEISFAKSLGLRIRWFDGVTMKEVNPDERHL